MAKISRKLKRNKQTESGPDPLLYKAIAYFKARDWLAADTTCREILRRNPRDHATLNFLSVVLTNKPDLELAEKYIREAIRIRPNVAAYYSNLGLILKEREKWPASFEAFARACKIDPQDDQSFYNLGTVHQALKENEQAKECYRRAIAINPCHVQALCSLCGLLSRQQESGEELHKVMGQMEALLSIPDIQAKEELGFVLARVQDKLGNQQKVFEFLDPANRMVRERFNYDVANEKNRLKSLENTFTPDLLREKEDEKKESGSADSSTIFIVGLPRSGTTLVEQILASHSQVAAGGELFFLNVALLASPHLTAPFRANAIRLPDYSRIAQVTGPELTEIAMAYLEATAPLRKGKKYLTDKMPHNFVHVGMIRLLFPNSKVIHCQRDPMDNGLSLYMQHFKALHPYMYSLKEIGEYYSAYHALMNYWRRLLPGYIHDIRYEDLVDNPEPTMRGLLKFCGLAWENACLEFYKLKRIVKTASEGQVDQPLYSSARGRWKKYEKHLEPLRQALRDGGVIP